MTNLQPITNYSESFQQISKFPNLPSIPHNPYIIIASFPNNSTNSEYNIQKYMNFLPKGNFKIDQSWATTDKTKQNKTKPMARKASLGNKQSLIHQISNQIDEPSTDIIDDSLLKILNKQRNQPYNAIPKPKKQTPVMNSQDKIKKTAISNKNIEPTKNQDTDLLSSMANRLQKLEKTCQNQRQEIKQQKQIINKVTNQNSFLKQMKDNSGKIYQEMELLKNKNQELEKKVTQMENYLKQYGLKWIGQKLQGKLDDKAIKKQITQSKYAYRLPSQIDISTIRRRIEQLNAGLELQGLGTEIYNQKGIHKLRKTQTLPMGFYSNGIVIKGFNFYPYKSKQSLKILADILDGYFPYIFKSLYPNGVMLEVVDYIDQPYIQQKKDEKIISLNDPDKKFQPMSKQEFLNKLPQQVIRNGKIIPIRGEIEKIFDGKSNNADKKISQANEYVQYTNGMIYIKSKCRQKILKGQLQEEDICTLKIRDEKGDIYIVQMDKSDKILDVIIQLRKILKFKFNLITNYPKKIYTGNEQQNLQQLHFYPNQNLHIQSIT